MAVVYSLLCFLFIAAVCTLTPGDIFTFSYIQLGFKLVPLTHILWPHRLYPSGLWRYLISCHYQESLLRQVALSSTCQQVTPPPNSLFYSQSKSQELKRRPRFSDPLSQGNIGMRGVKLGGCDSGIKGWSPHQMSARSQARPPRVSTVKGRGHFNGLQPVCHSIMRSGSADGQL